MSPRRQSSKLDIKDADVTPVHSEADLKSANRANGDQPDDRAAPDAAIEGVRNAYHGDTFVMWSDLDEDEEDNGAPGRRDRE